MPNSESILNKFIEKIDFTKLEGTPNDFYEDGLAFVKNGKFDDGIIEFVKIIKTVSRQDTLFANAVKELESMGFSVADIYAIDGVLETRENSNTTPISASVASQVKTPTEKKCPYCAETIKHEAIVCRFCGRDLNRISPVKENSNIPEKKKKPLWLSTTGVIIGCCILLYAYGIIVDLSAPSNANTYATPITLPTDKNSSTGDLCAWFLKTQLLRTQRLSGLTEFINWSLTKDMNSLTAEEIFEMVGLLIRHQPYQEDFVLKWKSLGPHPQAREFWELELQSVQMKIESVNAMEDAINRNDPNKFTDGWVTFDQSLDVGNRAESAMQKIRVQCIR